MVEEYFFVDVSEIRFKYKLSQEEIDCSIIHEHFLKFEDEVCYVMDENDKLIGIVSIGDLYRFYRGDKDTVINKKFSYISEIDYERAREIFDKIRTIHEVPIVREGRLIGCISNGKKQSYEEWKQAREGIEYECIGKHKWYKNSAKKIKNQF